MSTPAEKKATFKVNIKKKNFTISCRRIQGCSTQAVLWRILGICMIPLFFCPSSAPYWDQVVIFQGCCYCPFIMRVAALYNQNSFSFLTESVIDCLKFVSSHALGVTVMALSSYDPKMRAAAYHVLSCFYQHLEGARIREKRQVQRRGEKSLHASSLEILMGFVFIIW